MKIDSFDEYNEKVNRKVLLGLAAGASLATSITMGNLTSKKMDNFNKSIENLDKDVKDVKDLTDDVDSEKVIKLDKTSKKVKNN